MTISSTKPDAANHEAFLARVQQSAAVIDDKREEKVESAQTPREAAFAMYIRKSWKQATWMVMMLDFPDGKPLAEQNPHHLDLWNVFINAINRRMYGDKGNSNSESELDV